MRVMDRSGLVALVLAAAVSYGAAIGIAGVGLGEDVPLGAGIPDRPWSRPPPPDVYPLDDSTKLGEPVQMQKVSGSLHYIRG
jgi:hypothetical protein